MRRSSLAAVLAATTFLVACGGDDALSPDEFRSKADAICKEYRAKGQKIAQPQDLKDVPKFAAESKQVLQEQIKELEGLEPPEDLKKDYDRALEVLRQLIGKLDELAKAAQANDGAKVQSILQEASKLDDEGDRLAKKLGLKECGQ